MKKTIKIKELVKLAREYDKEGMNSYPESECEGAAVVCEILMKLGYSREEVIKMFPYMANEYGDRN